MNEKIETIKNLIRESRNIVVFTGAGASAESGIPTFRDRSTGLWENYEVEDLATPGAFQRDKALVWGWYEWRRKLIMQAQPNPAHLAIATLAQRVEKLTVVTQNVDDLHERAGSQNVIHLHGNIQRPYCYDCGRPYAFPPGIPDEPDGGRRLDPPRCSHCNGFIRPGVVWFGEPLPDREWHAALDACSKCDLMFVIGTSAVVQPAASLPQQAIARRVPVVQINPDSAAFRGDAQFHLLGAAGEIMPNLL